MHSDIVISEEGQSTKRKNKKKGKNKKKRKRKQPSPSLTSTSHLHLVFFLHLTSLRSSERNKNGQKAPEGR
jgi:hypothetical protein